MTSQDIIRRQTCLSEELQLLREFHYSNLGKSVRHRRNEKPVIPSKNTQEDVRALDVLAVCLTTGNAGEVVAAAFDKCPGHLHLTLAKNGRPTSEDVAATEEFLAAMTSAVHWTDIMPFLVKRSKNIVNRHITQLHRSISEFHKHFTDSVTDRKGSLDKEFPKSANYRRRNYRQGTPSFQCMLKDVINKCIDLSASTIDGSKNSYLRWADLVAASQVLERSYILNEFAQNMHPRNRERTDAAKQLKRRLGKVCLYTRLNLLMAKAKRWFPDGKITFHWVDDEVGGSGERGLELCADPMEVVGRSLQEDPLSPDIPEKIKRRFPNLIDNWTNWTTTHPHIHAEVRLILHLDGKLKQLSPRKYSEDTPQQSVGCSKRSCLCCEIWINSFNSSSQVRWMTRSGSYGKPHSDWALPGDGKWMDLTVVNGIAVRLENELSWFLPDGYHEYDSSEELILSDSL